MNIPSENQRGIKDLKMRRNLVLRIQHLLDEKDLDDIPLSIWRIRFKAPKCIMIPIVGTKTTSKRSETTGKVHSENGIKWNLLDGGRCLH